MSTEPRVARQLAASLPLLRWGFCALSHTCLHYPINSQNHTRAFIPSAIRSAHVGKIRPLQISTGHRACPIFLQTRSSTPTQAIMHNQSIKCYCKLRAGAAKVTKKARATLSVLHVSLSEALKMVNVLSCRLDGVLRSCDATLPRVRHRQIRVCALFENANLGSYHVSVVRTGGVSWDK